MGRLPTALGAMQRRGSMAGGYEQFSDDGSGGHVPVVEGRAENPSKSRIILLCNSDSVNQNSAHSE